MLEFFLRLLPSVAGGRYWDFLKDIADKILSLHSVLIIVLCSEVFSWFDGFCVDCGC